MADLTAIAAKSEASQGRKELRWLLEIVNAIKPKVILEIGVHRGHSLKVWQDAFNPDILIGIDHESNTVLEIYLLDVLRKVKFIQADSHDWQTGEQVVSALKGREIDFLFIDGDHMYDGVKKDFEMYAPLVRKGGIIAFDDMDLFDNPSVEVYKFWREAVDRWDSITFHSDSNGIGVVYL